jgi:transcriptional regulator with XRE-family HTH domain
MMGRAEFGEHIRKLRTDRGLTQAVAARAAGCHVSSWQRWEEGAIPQATRAPAIARALGIPTLALLEAPNGRIPVADLSVSADTLERIKRHGAPEIERAVEAAAEHVRRALQQAVTPPVAQRRPPGPQPRVVARKVRRRLASRWTGRVA